MTELLYGGYAVLCAVCYMALRILLALVLVFLFATTVGALAKYVERRFIDGRR